MPASIKITIQQAREAMERGEFGDEVVRAHARVAVILTQDWCPRWAAMRQWIYELNDDFALFEFVYNKTELFESFMAFKEKVWGNDRIPYIRFYRDGKLFSQSNDLTREEFLKRLGLS